MLKALQPLAFLLAATVLAGCAPYEARPDAPAAGLVLASNLAQDPYAEGRKRGANRNAFIAFGDSACEIVLGALGQFTNHDDGTKEARIEAGKRIYIRTDWENNQGIGNQQEARRNCYSLVSFVPEAGQRYEIRQTIVGGPARPACSATVRNVNEGAPVKSLQEHAFTGKCLAYIKRPGQP